MKKDPKINYWLMKSEPSTYSIDHLMRMPNQTDTWEGVRNYQARNFIKQMKLHDQAFFYHSSCDTPSIVGIIEIIQEYHPDLTAIDLHSKYYDPKSTKQNPRWFMVRVRCLEKFKKPIPLSWLKSRPEFKTLILLKPGNRLSVMPVTPQEWESILMLKEASYL